MKMSEQLEDFVPRIAGFMSGLLSEYDALRFSSSRCNFSFWDVVVLTASNEDQKEAYEMMIQTRLNSSNPLPKFVDYVVVADPAGCKIGNGGSTMHTLLELDHLYGKRITALRVLMLHCGGQSQRLPCTSVLGKVFAPLPLGRPMLEFIDIKLCNYIPLVKNMPPGVFLVSSDDIQPFCLDEDEYLSCMFSKDGFTVLAHPSSLEIGTKHGVYVLPTELVQNDRVTLLPVQRVLQKPTVDNMRHKNAVVRKKDGSEFCFSDSAFFFCHSISKKLVDFYKQVMPLSCEIDAYGDFLQCLGSLGNSDYVTDARNVSNASPDLTKTRLEVFELLHREPITALVLPRSAYIHFGTMPEYIHNLVDPTFVISRGKSKLPGLRHFFEPHCTDSKLLTKIDSYIHSDFSSGQSACIMRSIIGPLVRLNCSNVVIEYSMLCASISIGSECILSHCIWRNSTENLEVPNGTFLYTLAVRDSGFATVAFGVHDDLKLSASSTDLKFLNGKVDYQSINRTTMALSTKSDVLNLWNAKLFSIHDSPEKSFADTLHFVNSLVSRTEQPTCDDELFSISDLLYAKNIKRTILLRQATLM